MRKRFCGVSSCPNFTGTADENVRFFKLPIYEPELLVKWKQAVNREMPGNFLLCYLHFRQEDLIGSKSHSKLKPGAIPIPVPTVKTEISDEPPIEDPLPDEPTTEEPHTEHVEIMDIDAIKSRFSASDEQELCTSCIKYNIQLQAAHAEIAALKKKLSELTEENRIRGRKCRLCQAQLTQWHLCIDAKNIVCPLCSHPFVTTASFLKHIEDQHAELTQVASNRLLYKCDQCTLGYPMEILLECHKKAHENATKQSEEPPPPTEELNRHDITHESIKQEPEELNTLIEPDVQILIDDTASNDSSVLSVYMVTVESDDEKSSGNKPPAATVDASSDEVEIIEMSDDSLNETGTLKLFKCGTCEESFETTKELNDHVRENHKWNHTLYTCHLCEKDCHTQSNLQSHFKHHVKMTKCQVCKRSLKLDDLNSHLCGKEKSIRCDYCPNEFTTTSKLVEHLEKSHETNVKFYQCEKCKKCFPMIALKDFHMISHAQDEPKPFVCEICSKAFSKEYYLKVHSETHDAPKSHLCEECGKGFPSKRNLQKHQDTHDPNRKPTIQCPDCPRKFYNAQHLRRHSDVHREHDYICHICQAVLKSLLGLRKHLKIHDRTESDRKYACKICPRKFFNSYSLRSHRKVHTGVRLFNCRFCSQTYKYSGDLNKHLKTHLGKKIYSCPKCPKRFEYPNELQKHEFKHYKEEKEAN
ncbi:zinc finger protein 595-like [Sitodiplosis mosellana]|uniref:zinc finger protein 595-like n=1 Tax=Sitodiplosis mosellana TaxID=263140 RepID=UPI00244377A6|nr:zinc finger protein 595-like [Sitodiplosis mosellana]